MKTVILTGMSELDLNNQQWAWQTSGTRKTIFKQWPDELLPLTMQSPRSMQKLLPVSDRLSRKIDYKEE
jgi:hypothetical protein